jgi:hypothetical protein
MPSSLPNYHDGRRNLVILSSAVAVILLVGLAVTVFTRTAHKRPDAKATQSTTGAEVPTEAVTATANLVSGDLRTVRAGVSRLIASRITSPAMLAPTGSTLQVDRHSWHQRGDDASLEATLSSPGRAPVRERLYLIREAGHWRVLFSERAA